MVIRNALPISPPLDGSVIPMAELPRERANAAASCDEVNVIHTQHVRGRVRCVNVENDAATCELPYVSDERTIGDKLRALRERSGLSIGAVAKGAGYKTASGVQRFFESSYDPPALPLDIARKLADGFTNSSVSRAEIFALAGYDAEPDAQVVKFEGAADVQLGRDVPVYGTALGAPLDFGGVAIEQTELLVHTVVDYFVRPTVLQNRPDVYGFYVQGSSMAPRFEEGDMGFVETKRPPRVGDDVIVQLRAPIDDGEEVTAALIKRLVRRSASYIELEQFNPATTFRIEAEKVKFVHRVIPWRELLS